MISYNSNKNFSNTFTIIIVTTYLLEVAKTTWANFNVGKSRYFETKIFLRSITKMLAYT